MRALFICTENRLRSPTAHAVFASHPEVEALSAGTNRDADTTVSGDLIEWADVVFYMERAHKNRVSKRFQKLLQGKRTVVLGIPDNYDYMDPDLVRVLRRRVSRHLGIDEDGW